LIKFFASQDKQNEIAAKYKAGNYGYGHAKLELLDILLEYFGPARKKFAQFMENPKLLEEKISSGNIAANILADEKYEKLVKLVGLEN
jgi:tryptophanyl-tRNA synthetase